MTDKEVKRAVSKLTREKLRKEAKKMREETPMFDKFDDETKFALLTFRVAGMIEDGKIDEEEIEKSGSVRFPMQKARLSKSQSSFCLGSLTAPRQHSQVLSDTFI